MAQQLKARSDLHLSRKVFHLSSIFLMFALMVFLPRWVCWSIYAVIGVPMILIDFSRHYIKPLNEVFMKVIGPVLREGEENRASGAAYSLISVALVYSLFPAPIAELSILFLAIGDPVASLVGIKLGGPKLWRNKSLSGTLAGMAICAMAAFGYIYFFLEFKDITNTPPALPFPGLVLNSLILGVIAGLAEAIPVHKLDDNLSQPLISSTLMYLMVMIGRSL